MIADHLRVDVARRTTLSTWLDFFRWVAAFEVLLSHLRHRVFGELDAGASHIARGFYYLISISSSLSQPAVIVFFVLSGYLVGGGALKKYLRTGSFDWQEYFVARFVRLWSVLIPVFALTFIMVAIGSTMPSANLLGIYEQETNIGLSHLACNLAFLQTAACEQYGKNGALWSLFNEFWYYCAWPFIMIGFWSTTTKLAYRVASVLIALVGLGILTSHQFVGPNVLLYFSLWLIGVAASEAKKPFLPVNLIPSAALFVVSLLVWRLFSKSEVQGTNTIYEFSFDLIVALLFANLVVSLKTAEKVMQLPFEKYHAMLAGFSFTLYCLHIPVIHFLASFSEHWLGFGWKDDPSGVGAYLAFLAIGSVCLLTAWALSKVTEGYTYGLRQAVLNTLRGQVSAPGSSAQTYAKES